MRKLHALYAVLLVGAVVGLLLAGSPHRPKTKRTKRAPGAPPAPRSVQPAAPKARLAGTVRRADGTPVRGATVFVLNKAKPGGIRDRLPHEVTDAAGRWTLRARDVEESWIGVVAAGYRHAWLDGAAWKRGAGLDHTLERAPALKVTLVDADGRPIRKKGVQLEAWPPRTTYFLPGPRARQGEQWKVTDAQGTATFHVGDAGPVTLTPHVEGRYSEAGSTWVEKAEGEMTLRMLPSLSLQLKLTAADTSFGLRSLVTVDLHDAKTGSLALSHTDSSDENGILEIRRAIRPGVYDVHVHGEGRGSVVLPNLAFVAGSETRSVAARMPVAKPPATLRLELGPSATGGGRRRAPLVFLFRPMEPWRSHGWESGAPDEWNPEDGSLVLALPPDRYHVLVADVLSKRAALLRDVDLAAGSAKRVKLSMRPGLRTSVNALIAARGRSRRVEVMGAGAERLPVYGITGDGRIRVSRGVDVLARVEEGAGVYLGPYPFDVVTIRVTGWDGKQVTHEVKH